MLISPSALLDTLVPCGDASLAMNTPVLAALAALLVSVLASTQPARGGVVLGNLGSDGSDDLGFSGALTSDQLWIAQGFNTGASSLLYLDAITLGLDHDFGPTSVTLFLYSNNSGSPGSALISASATVSTNSQKIQFGFAGYQLVTNTTYWAVIGTNNLVWMEADAVANPAPQNGSGYSYSGLYFTTNGGSSWVTNGPYTDISLSVEASAAPAAVPEPGSWGAAVLLLGAAAFVFWRRRSHAA